MDRSAFATHVSICLVVGGFAWWFTGVNPLAAAFWCSAVLYVTGSVAYVEDFLPGGFDNPDGRDPPLGSLFALKSFSIALVLAGLGAALQLWLGGNAS
jgi:hypothetical protein